MAAKIPVQVHIGVVVLTLPPEAASYDKMVVSLTDLSGVPQVVELDSAEVPVPDEFGIPHFVVDFQDVQSGGDIAVEVQSRDTSGNPLGHPASHTVNIPEVPDPVIGTFLAPQSIFVTF